MRLCALPDAMLHVVLLFLTTLDLVGLRGINRHFRDLVRDHPWCDASTLVPHGRVAQWLHAFPRAWLVAYDVSDRGRTRWRSMPAAEDLRQLCLHHAVPHERLRRYGWFRTADPADPDDLSYFFRVLWPWGSGRCRADVLQWLSEFETCDVEFGERRLVYVDLDGRMIDPQRTRVLRPDETIVPGEPFLLLSTFVLLHRVPYLTPRQALDAVAFKINTGSVNVDDVITTALRAAGHDQLAAAARTDRVPVSSLAADFDKMPRGLMGLRVNR